MKYNLREIMKRAHELRKAGKTISTALKLAWGEAKGEKRYSFHLEDARAGISAYLAKLVKNIRDIHDQHKLDILKAALLAKMDSKGIAVFDGKTVGLCKYAVKNA